MFDNDHFLLACVWNATYDFCTLLKASDDPFIYKPSSFCGNVIKTVMGLIVYINKKLTPLPKFCLSFILFVDRPVSCWNLPRSHFISKNIINSRNVVYSIPCYQRLKKKYKQMTCLSI